MIWKSNELVQKLVISSVGNIASQFLNKITFTQTLTFPPNLFKKCCTY